MNLRFSHLIGLLGTWLVLTATPASAQFANGGRLQELQFTSGATSPTCSASSASFVDNIVWGTSSRSKSKRSSSTETSSSCQTSQESFTDDNIVWGTLFEDNIVWGTFDTTDNIVWGTVFEPDNIVWGTDDTSDNIVWGTGFGDDNIVWGTAAAPSSAFDF